MEHTGARKREEVVQKIAENLQIYDTGREVRVDLGDSTRTRPKCKFCDQSFSSTKTLKIHLRDKHGDTSEMKEKQVACLEPGCDFRCRVIDDLTRHLATVHSREFTQEQYQFESWDTFLKWKEATERESRCTFIKMGGHQHHGGDFEKLYFYCSRTGFYRARGATSRRMKQQGTKKLGGYCTAKMVVYVTKNGEPCPPELQSNLPGSPSKRHLNRVGNSQIHSNSQCIEVLFTREHYGHTFELKHLTLSKTERNVIVEMLKERLTAEEILKQLRDASRTEEGMERIHLVTRKDISNIARQYNLPYVYSRGRTHSTGSEDGVNEHDFAASGAEDHQQLGTGAFYSEFDENGEMEGMRELHEQGIQLAVSEVEIDEQNGRITLVQQVADADADADEGQDAFRSTFACTVTLLHNGDEPHACDGPQCAACDYACIHRYACDCFDYSSLRSLCAHIHFVHAYLNNGLAREDEQRASDALDTDTDLQATTQRSQLHAADAEPSIIDDVSALVGEAPQYEDADAYTGHYADANQYENAYAYESMKNEEDDPTAFYASASGNYADAEQAEASAVAYGHYTEAEAHAADYSDVKVHAGVESELIHCSSQLETDELRSQIVDRLDSLRQAVASSANTDTLNALLSRLSDVTGILDVSEPTSSALPFANRVLLGNRQSTSASRNVSVLRGTRNVARHSTRPSNSACDREDPPVTDSNASVSTSVTRQPNIVAITPSAHIRKVVPTVVRSQTRRELDDQPIAKVMRVAAPSNATVITGPPFARPSRLENSTNTSAASKSNMIIRVVKQHSKGTPGANSSSVPDAALNVEVQ